MLLDLLLGLLLLDLLLLATSWSVGMLPSVFRLVHANTFTVDAPTTPVEDIQQQLQRPNCRVANASDNRTPPIARTWLIGRIGTPDSTHVLNWKVPMLSWLLLGGRSCRGIAGFC